MGHVTECTSIHTVHLPPVPSYKRAAVAWNAHALQRIRWACSSAFICKDLCISLMHVCVRTSSHACHTVSMIDVTPACTSAMHVTLEIAAPARVQIQCAVDVWHHVSFQCLLVSPVQSMYDTPFAVQLLRARGGTRGERGTSGLTHPVQRIPLAT